MQTATCNLCPFNCEVPMGQVGKCKIRGNKNGDAVRLLTYGIVTTMIEGPVEQKPLYHFYPGMKVLSIGGSGCNMFCSYCQNFEISQVSDENSPTVDASEVVDKAISLDCKAIAFTYSEPFVWYEYVMNVAVQAKKRGLKTILKTNGYATESYFKELLEWIDAVNIDLKGSAKLYKEVAGIDLPADPKEWIIMKNIGWANRKCHLEISTIVIPPYCDDQSAISELVRALTIYADHLTPIHVLKFIPDFKLRDTLPPTMEQLQKVRQAFLTRFRHVYIDYAGVPAQTSCLNCGYSLVERDGIKVVKNNLMRGKKCPNCLYIHNFEG